MARAPKRPSGVDLKQFGDTGLSRLGGYVNDEFLPTLRGKRARRVYREMSDNDPIVGAVMFAFSALIRQVKFSATPCSDEQAAVDVADFVHECLFDDMSTTWGSVVEEICTMFVYGFAPMEVVYKVRGGPGNDPTRRSMFDDGRYGIRKIYLIGQPTVESWDFDDDGGIQGLRQYTPEGHSASIPIDRMLLFRTSAVMGNPEGRSLLRNAYRPWYYKRRIEEIEAIGVERDLAGYPVMKIPARLMDAGASSEERAAFVHYQNTVKRIRRDQNEGLVLPSDRDEKGNPLFELSLLSTGGSRVFDTTKIIDAKAREIATSVLADFIFLGQRAVGSFALSSDKTEMFSAALGGYLASICAVFNRHLLPRLLTINGIDLSLMPALTYGDVEQMDLDKIASTLGAMVSGGAAVFPDRDLENALRRRMGLPELPEETGDDDPGAAAMPRPKKNEDEDQVEDGGDE